MTPEYLEELADIADPDELWKLRGLDQLALPLEKRRQLDTAVALRRYAGHIRRSGEYEKPIRKPKVRQGRKRMTWDWVGEYPVFVYTTWLGPCVFNVDILIGVKGDQQAGSHGPNDTPDLSYIENQFYSKNEVASGAFKAAKVLINKLNLSN